MTLSEVQAARVLELGLDLRRAAAERTAIALRAGFAELLLAGPAYEESVAAEDAASRAFSDYINELAASGDSG